MLQEGEVTTRTKKNKK